MKATSDFRRSPLKENMNKKPNILVVLTDQQSAHMMSCAGNNWVKTPAIDRLAASGVRFARAYCANPVCVPSRFSLQTGRMPSAMGMKWNQELPVPDAMVKQSLGILFNAAGYETVYGGKVHLPGVLKNIETNGYKCLTTDDRQGLADACVKFIKQPHETPFFLFASFINPHDICYLAINDALRTMGRQPIDNVDSKTCLAVADVIKTNFSAHGEALTPLPANHAISESEPHAISSEYLTHEHQGAHFRRHAREEWGEKEWRIFRHVYRKLSEMVDAKIGQVLDSLREAGLEENTLVVFTSDHGDMDGAHKLQHKSVLYEEAVRIPFIMSHKGAIREGLIDDDHLVSNGLDLLPTLCDYAGIKIPEGLSGSSIRPLAEGKSVSDWRNNIVVESLHGRMLRTGRYKYTIYASGENAEQLIDLDSDPGEMINLVNHKDCRDLLHEHRRIMKEWVKNTGDTIGLEYIGSG